jgi:hypothetical protein
MVFSGTTGVDSPAMARAEIKPMVSKMPPPMSTMPANKAAKNVLKKLFIFVTL